MSLEVLSQFLVEEVDRSFEGGDVRIRGRFSHLRGVKDNRGWLYCGEGNALIGDLETLPTDSNQSVTFVTPDAERADMVEVGHRMPWLDGYWQAYHLDMVLSTPSQWRQLQFAPRHAQYFTLNGVTGWQLLGQPLPAGAVATKVVSGGWDHEHCELCDQRIGVGGDEDGWLHDKGWWLCARCFARYAARHDVSFAVRPNEEL